MSEAAPSEDLQVVRTAGLVLSVFGVISVAITLAWNGIGDRPDPDTLVVLSGQVVDRGLITVPTRTAIERWLALDVEDAGQTVRWILPAYSEPLEALLEEVVIGSPIEGRALPDEKLLRWYDEPVRVMWSLSQGGREPVGYADVDRAVQADRYQSPLAAGLTLGLGVLLLGVGALRSRARSDA